ncbi:MAG: HTH-type transcriptional repressor CarH [Bacteroidia bacterium]|nr:HTH-type transcriptional repressor CarH [Bacteroidia bacterium]
MGHYSIKDLEKLSGVKAHTIRIWEKRFKIIEPSRTETNFRYYSDEQLKKLLNISLLNNSGYKISKIASLCESEICKEVEKVASGEKNYDAQIEQLIVSMIEMDEEKFEQHLNNQILKDGFEDAMLHVVYPFFDKVGILWQTGNVTPAQEHFVSNLIRQKLIVAIDGLPKNTTSESKSFLLFLPEGELHEIGILFTNYILRKNGHRVIYLGQSLPLEDLARVVRTRKPDFLVTYITSPIEGGIKQYIQAMQSACNGQPVYVAGMQSCNIDFANLQNVHCIASTGDIHSLLESLKN